MQIALDDTTRILAIPARPTVLLVDDDEPTRELFARFLRDEGLPVMMVSSAEDALAIMREHFPQIVVTDIQMPGMDGLTLCRELRATRLQGYVYIIVITGQDPQEGAVAALRAGADDYLHKNVSRAELAARLQTAQRIVTLEHRLRSMLDTQRHLAACDTLTGLPNRRAFSKHISAEFKRARRFKHNLAVAILDIDHFKAINDRYGHAVGDAVLTQLASRVSSALPRAFDFFARLGGEEFVLLLPQTDAHGAAVVAERLRQMVAEKPFQVAEYLIPVTVSIGVSALSERVLGEESTPEDVLDLADQRLYTSKNSGRNRVTSSSAHPRGLSD